MFDRAELKQNLMAMLEVALFMPNGVERYSPTKSAAMRSFIVPLLFMPLVVWIWIVRAEAEPVSAIIAVQLVRMIVTIGVFFGLVYLLSRQYGRQEHFFRFITASNWHELLGAILVLPVIVSILIGADMQGWENYAVFVQIMGYVYTGFIATHVFRLPWEMGGFVGVLALAVGQNMLDLGLYVQSLVTVPLVV